MHKVIGIALAAIAITAQAGVYKWVDGQGKVHFSDSPPAGKSAQAVKVSPSSGLGGAAAAPAKQPSLAEQEAGFKQRRMDKADAEVKAQKEAEQAEQKRQYCSDLKGHLAGLKSGNSRLVKYDENGKRQTLSSSDKQTEIARTEQNLQERCSD